MKVFKVRPDAILPTRGKPGVSGSRSAGIDFYIPHEWNRGRCLQIQPGRGVMIPSGLILEIPEGYMLMMDNKGGVASKKLLLVGAKIVDEDYMGETHLNVINVGNSSVIIRPGEKLVQGILVPVLYEEVEQVDSLDEMFIGRESQRGTGMTGSTGEDAPLEGVNNVNNSL